MDVYELSKKLESKGFKVFYTNTIAETRGLLTELIGRTDTVGAGGSATLDEIGIGEALKERGNTVYIRRLTPDVNPDEVMKKAVFADWFLTSTNALTEDGEFVNVDGNCNRIASMLYGGKNTVFVLGVNKIVKDVPAALERIRTIAAKKNCLRFGYLSNPCVTGGDCKDCPKDTNICHATSIITLPPRSKTVYVVIVNKELGY